MKEILDKILETLLRVFLAISFVFGTLQFIFVAVATLFGVQYGWLQYLASVVLLACGLVAIKALININTDADS